MLPSSHGGGKWEGSGENGERERERLYSYQHCWIGTPLLRYHLNLTQKSSLQIFTLSIKALCVNFQWEPQCISQQAFFPSTHESTLFQDDTFVLLQ